MSRDIKKLSPSSHKRIHLKLCRNTLFKKFLSLSKFQPLSVSGTLLLEAISKKFDIFLDFSNFAMSTKKHQIKCLRLFKQQFDNYFNGPKFLRFALILAEKTQFQNRKKLVVFFFSDLKK